MQDLSDDDGGRAAASASPNARTEEDSEMQHEASEDDKADPSPEEDDMSWTDAVSRAQRRRQRKAENKLSVPSAPPVTQAPPAAHKPMPRPSTLPRDDYKLVLRPQDGLKLSDIQPSVLSLTLLQATHSTWQQANLRLRIDAVQNTATISTPSKEIAKALGRLTQIHIGNITHGVQLYGLAPDDAVKGVIRGVPSGLTEAEILKNIDQDRFEVYSCRRLGKESTTVVLTFAGPKVPYYVRLYGAEHPCSLYKKTVSVCSRCHEVGHRITACPHPNIHACHQCGTRNPSPGHTCVAKCDLCEGPHLTGTKGCPKRFITPYLLRKREYQKRQAEERSSRRDQTTQRGRPRDRSSTPQRKQSRNRSSSPSRKGSRSSTRPGSQSRSASRSGSSVKQVSWASKVSPAALETQSQFPALIQNTQTPCTECSQLKAQLAQQTKLIVSLQARLEAIEQAQPNNPSDKRKKPNHKPSTTVTATPPPPQETEAIQTTSTTDINPAHSTKPNNPAKDIQEAILHMSKVLTDRMDMLHNAVLQEVREIKQDVQTLRQDVQVLKQETQNHATRLGRLEADMSHSASTQSARRPTPYSRPNIEKTTNSIQDGPKQ